MPLKLPPAFVLCVCAGILCAQEPAPDPVAAMVSRLDLARYKTTIKGLTQFGDRRQGTDRNRAAIDWIEAQVKSDGCTNSARLEYKYATPPGPAPNTAPLASGAGQGAGPLRAVGGGRPRGDRARTGVNDDPNAQRDPRFGAVDMRP